MTAARTEALRPTVYASTGAVAQHGGSLKVYRCTTCRHEVVWATSSRTGRRYLANVQRGQADQRYYIAAALHSCPEPIYVDGRGRSWKMDEYADLATGALIRAMAP